MFFLIGNFAASKIEYLQLWIGFMNLGPGMLADH